MDIPFGVYLGWVSVASIANITDYLYYLQWTGFGIAPQAWAVIMLAIATLVGLAMAFLRRDAAFLLVLVWAFSGIAVKQADAALVVGGAWVATAAAFILALLSILQRRRATA